MKARWLACGVSCALFSLVGGCNEAPPALASALVVVDTDLPVPRALSRLRIDIYGEDGTWLHSRDVPLARADEWPASFGVVSPDESKETTVLVRLRGYAEGATRDYRGARKLTPPTYEPPWTAITNAELCERSKPLAPFEEITLRRSERPVITDSCSTFGGSRNTSKVNVGSVGVRIEIKAAGKYRFEVVRSIPDATFGTDTTLSLRRDCNDPQTEIACADDIGGQSSLSRLVVNLEPGIYALLTGGAVSGPADLTLRWAPADEWSRASPPAAPTPAPGVPRDPWPRLVTDARDTTPTQEPHPAATVDRLVRVRLTPGVQSRVRVTLEGSCAGSEATLVSASDRRVAIDAARSCNGADATGLVPEMASDDAARARPSLVGTFSNETCDPSGSDDAIVCVAGGAFAMGGFERDGVFFAGESRTLPIRVVGVRRFYIDRREVTVGRYRQALAAGLPIDVANEAHVNDGPLVPGAFTTQATFSSRPMGRESHPINAIGWKVARALCVRAGGDLPTEAQWEYAAGVAGREYKQTFPTGNGPLSCDVGVNARDSEFGGCRGLFVGAEAVDAPAASADVNALGILGLTGNVAEFTRDASQPFDHACWAVNGSSDPTCEDPSAPFHTARGGSWRDPHFFANVTGRRPSARRNEITGFRCVYASPPDARWRGL